MHAHSLEGRESDLIYQGSPQVAPQPAGIYSAQSTACWMRPQVMAYLNALFTLFDELIDEYEVRSGEIL